ncbi:MAG: hypothetical protein H7839_00265 [Magnetococcus sp. YQC-5]
MIHLSLKVEKFTATTFKQNTPAPGQMIYDVGDVMDTVCEPRKPPENSKKNKNDHQFLLFFRAFRAFRGEKFWFGSQCTDRSPLPLLRKNFLGRR